MRGNIKTNRIIFTVAAVMILFCGVFDLARVLRLKSRCSAAAVGTVVSFEKQKKRRGTDYRANVAYTVGDELITVKTAWRSSKFGEGEVLRVMYDPKDPQTAYVIGAEGNNYVLFFISGAVFACAAFTLHLRIKRSEENVFEYKNRGV